MAAKRSKLSNQNLGVMKSAKATAPAEIERPEGSDGKKDTRQAQTLRLPRDAWRQLKILALDQSEVRASGKRTSAHDLLVEAVNDLFRKYGKPPLA